MCETQTHTAVWPKQTHAHSESTIFCTNPISGTIHGGLRGVVQAACDVFACKQAKPYRAMNITCIWAYLNIRCPSGVHLLRPSLCVWAVCDEKNIGLTCKPSQVPRAAQAGLCCHLQLEAFPWNAAPEAKASSCRLPTKEQACDDEASCHWFCQRDKVNLVFVTPHYPPVFLCVCLVTHFCRQGKCEER